MKLSGRLAADFSATVRKRGEGYYWQGLVRIQHGSDSKLEARVQGSRPNDVSLVWEDGALSAWCDCPYFDPEGPCKHLWAAILAAEARGYLAAAASAADLVLDYGGYDLAEELDDEAVPAFPLRPPAVVPKLPAWQTLISEISIHGASIARTGDVWPARRQIRYIVDVPGSVAAACLLLSLESCDRRADGSWTRHRALVLKRSQIAHLPLPTDREILSALAGGHQFYGWSYANSSAMIPGSCLIPHPLSAMVVPLMARTGRCYLRRKTEPDDGAPLAWDEGGAWHFGLEMRRRDQEKGWVVAALLGRAEERMELATPLRVTQGGFVFTRDRVAPLAEGTPFEWMVHLRQAGCIQAPEGNQDDLLAALLSSPGLPPLEVPEELRYEELTLKPRPCLRVRAADPAMRGAGRLRAELSFD